MNQDAAELCFYCYDQTIFRLIGQTGDYNALKNEAEYLDKYIAAGKPTIKCGLCDGHVRYEKRIDGKWSEVNIEVATETNEMS